MKIKINKRIYNNQKLKMKNKTKKLQNKITREK